MHIRVHKRIWLCDKNICESWLVIGYTNCFICKHLQEVLKKQLSQCYLHSHRSFSKFNCLWLFFLNSQITHHFLSLWNWRTLCCVLADGDPERRHEPANRLRILTSPVHMPDTHSLCNEEAWWTVAVRKQHRMLKEYQLNICTSNDVENQ